MDQELKQRLIGASVIIALAVIFIPMLFDNEVNQESSKKIDIVIPEAGTNELTVKSFSLDDSDEVEVGVVNDLPDSELVLEDNALVLTDGVSGNGLIEATEQKPDDNSEQVIPEKVSEVAKDDIALEDEPLQNNLPEEKDDADNEKPANEKPANEKPSPVELASEDSQSEETMVFRVKLGSFSQAENAQQLKSKLAQKGIGTLIELATDKALYRVWSEAIYQNKDKAEAYVAAVNKLNFNIGQPKIIKVSEKDIKQASAKGQLGWVVQLGSFAAKDNALDLRNKLKLAGFTTAFVDQSSNSRGETRYRLRVGPMNNQQQATESKQQILNKLKLDGLVKTHELAPLVD